VGKSMMLVRVDAIELFLNKLVHEPNLDMRQY
jgi:hypothetical protein